MNGPKTLAAIAIAIAAASQFIVPPSTELAARSSHASWLAPTAGLSGSDSALPNPAVPVERLDFHRASVSHLLAEDRLGDEQRAQLLARRGVVNVDAEQLARAYPLIDLVQPIAVEQANTPFIQTLSEQRRNDGREFVAYDPWVIESKQVGDTISLQIGDFAVPLDATIGEVLQAEDGGVLVFEGAFDNFDGPLNRFKLFQAIGDDYAVANITTPQGSYTLEAKDGAGWIVKQETEHMNLHDDGLPS